MPLTVNDFECRVEGADPGSASFDLQHGRATLPLYVRVNRTSVPGAEGDLNPNSTVLPDDLMAAPQVILGGISTDVGDGRIIRLLPLAHPQWPWLYASAIHSVRGIGGPPIKLASISPLEALPMPFYSLYSVYEFVVEFTTRNYAVLPDDEIEFGFFHPQQFIDVDGDPAPEVDQHYVTEWSRFTEYQVVPQNDWVTCTIGSDFVFQSASDNPLSQYNPGANGGAPFPAMPRLLLPNEIIKFTWHLVPWRYYSSPDSYLRRFRGKINQFDWYNWQAGELLYLSCNPIRYTPPILQAVNWLNGSTTIEKWATMELIFLATKRTGVNLPFGGTVSSDNENFVINGHNLMPWHGDHQFYYVQSKTTGVPTFYSFPFELLWTDPDANNNRFGDDEGGEPDVNFVDDVIANLPV